MEVDEAVQEYARGVDECCSVYKVDEEYRILYNIENVGTPKTQPTLKSL